MLRKPVAVWSHLDIDFAAEVAEGVSGLELGAGALLPALPSGRRRVRRPRLPPTLSAAHRVLTCGRACAAAEGAGAACSGCAPASWRVKSTVALQYALRRGWVARAISRMPVCARGGGARPGAVCGRLKAAACAGRQARAAEVLGWVQPRAAAVRSLRMRGVREAEAEPGRQARLGFAAARLPDPYLERLSDFSGCAASLARQPGHARPQRAARGHGRSYSCAGTSLAIERDACASRPQGACAGPPGSLSRHWPPAWALCRLAAQH